MSFRIYPLGVSIEPHFPAPLKKKKVKYIIQFYNVDIFMHNIFGTMKLNIHANDQEINKQKEAQYRVNKSNL